MDYSQIAQVNNVFNDENRLRIVDMLSCYPMSGTDLLEKLKVSQPTLSFHLNKLVTSNLILCEKVGTKKIYQLNKEILNSYLESLHLLCSEKETCKCFEENNEKI